MSEKQQEINELTGEYHADVNFLIDRIDELKSYVKRLRGVIVDATNNGAMLDSGKWIYSIDDAVLSETPAQSLNHIKAQVEEETIEYDAKLMDADHNEYAASRIRERERKYKEQSDEG